MLWDGIMLDHHETNMYVPFGFSGYVQYESKDIVQVNVRPS